MANVNIREYLNDTSGEKATALRDAQALADLTIPSLYPDQDLNNTFTKSGSRRPKSRVPAIAVKGLVAALVNTIAPANVRFFRILSDPKLEVYFSAGDKQRLDSAFVKAEDECEQWLARHNFHSFQYPLVERDLIEGSVAVKVDPKLGLMMYPLKTTNITRSWGKMVRLVLEEYFYEDGQRKKQYIMVDYQKNKVYVQREDETKAKETGEFTSQYFVVSTEIPAIGSYARPYYADFYGLLSSIDEATDALNRAKKICSWSWLTFNGPETISTDYISKIQPMSVVRMESHDAIKWHTAGQSIADWSFVAQQLASDEQRLLQLSAVGLANRAAQVQTATEVLAIKAELDSLVGATAQILAQTFYSNVINALLDILGHREAFAAIMIQALGGQSPANLDDSTLLNVAITTGAPALAREVDLGKLYQAINQLSSVLGPQNVAPYINVSGLLKETANGLKVNTEGIILDPEEVQQQQQAQALAQQQAQLDQQGGANVQQQ